MSQGRDTKFDEHRSARILSDLAAGLTRKCAAARAGIHSRTLDNWVSRGKRGEEPFAAFYASIKKAEHDAEARCVGLILKTAEGTWQCAAWYLERKHPESWGASREMIAELRRAMKEVEKMRDELRKEIHKTRKPKDKTMAGRAFTSPSSN